MKSPQRILMLFAALFAALVLVAGCNKGIKLSDGTLVNEGNNGSLGSGNDNGGDAGGGPVLRNSWESIKGAVDGKVEGSGFDGQPIIQVDEANESLVFLLPIPFPTLLIPVTSFNIPQLPGALVYQVTDINGGTSIAVRIPLKYMIKGANLAPYNTLPNGDPLVRMPAGENRGFVIAFPETPDIKLNLYLATNAAAAFLEIPALKLPDEWLRLTLGFPIKNRTGTQEVGYLALVPNKGTSNAGVYVASRLPTSLAISMDELLRD